MIHITKLWRITLLFMIIINNDIVVYIYMYIHILLSVQVSTAVLYIHNNCHTVFYHVTHVSLVTYITAVTLQPSHHVTLVLHCHIYCNCHTSQLWHISLLSQTCTTQDTSHFLYTSHITFVTCIIYLFSLRIMIGDDYETVFLLSGDDLKVHLYRKVLRNDEVNFWTSLVWVGDLWTI